MRRRSGRKKEKEGWGKALQGAIFLACVAHRKLCRRISRALVLEHCSRFFSLEIDGHNFTEEWGISTWEKKISKLIFLCACNSSRENLPPLTAVKRSNMLLFSSLYKIYYYLSTSILEKRSERELQIFLEVWKYMNKERKFPHRIV